MHVHIAGAMDPLLATDCSETIGARKKYQVWEASRGIPQLGDLIIVQLKPHALAMHVSNVMARTHSQPCICLRIVQVCNKGNNCVLWAFIGRVVHGDCKGLARPQRFRIHRKELASSLIHILDANYQGRNSGGDGVIACQGTCQQLCHPHRWRSDTDLDTESA